jgi:hypothetical protein
MSASSALAERVRNVRGVYGLSKPFRFINGLVIVLFTFVVPPFLAYVIYTSHLPLRSWNADVWTVAAMIPASIGIAYVFYWGTRIRWKFTDTEIICLKPGGIAWRLAYSEIAAVEIRRASPFIRVLWLQSANGPRTVVLSDAQLVRSVDAPAT